MKKIIIIGGGVSGLTAGIYAQKSGFESIILERHFRVGGLCTWWDRKGYHLDGCIHWLTGTHEGTDLYNIWKDTGVIKSNDDFFVQQECGVIDYQGERVTLYADPKKLEQEFLRVAPEDEKQIKVLMSYLKEMINVPLPLSEPINAMKFGTLMKTGFSLLPHLSFMNKISNLSCEEYAKRFKSPIMRFFITEFQTGPGSLYAMLYSFATILYKNGGIPKQVSKGMIDRMEETYLSLGGKIRTNASVENIEIVGKSATGVTLKNGEFIGGDYIVSAVDANVLLHNLLKDRYKNKALQKRLLDFDKYPCPSAFVVYFAVNKEKIKQIMSSHVSFFPTREFKVGERRVKSMSVRNFAFDPYFDKDGNTVLEAYIEQYNDSYIFWNELMKNKKEYIDHKMELSKAVLNAITKQYPELKEEDFTFLDAFTPKTLERYTGSFMGSFMSFMMTHDTSILMHNGHIKGINNLQVASQWAQSPGGLPIAAATGMFAVQRILKQEKRDHMFFKRSIFKYT